MIIHRLGSSEYIKDLSGSGAKLYGGRWNSVGFPSIYTTENISLAILEILVHMKSYKRPLDYHLLKINVPDSIKPMVISSQKLKKNWKDDPAYTQFMGDEFLKSNQTLLLKVPSVIVDDEYNYLLNPAHADIDKLKIISIKHFEFDKRLILTNE